MAARLVGDVETTVDAFHRGGFHLVQPAKGAHRSGVDATIVAAAVPDGFAGMLADSRRRGGGGRLFRPRPLPRSSRRPL